MRERGVSVTTATSLWMGEREGRAVIGVTGTKGKSTTAMLIAHLARATGGEVHVVGNIGEPALNLLDRPGTELAVVELSSYQIADLEVGPEIAMVTNLYREHTDWHGSYETYRAEKLRLLSLPGVRASVLNGRDPELADAITPRRRCCMDAHRDGTCSMARSHTKDGRWSRSTICHCEASTTL